MTANMLITLTGTVISKAAQYAVIEAYGLGYQVFMPGGDLARARVGEEVRVWVHDAVREESHDLFGFFDEAAHRLFRTLLGVSGIGPKGALAVLSLGDAREAGRRIEAGDVAWLSSVPGIGKKTAQKIVLELQGKLVGADGGDDELVSALVGLGYSRDDARDAAAGAGEGAVEQRLRIALRQLGKK